MDEKPWRSNPGPQRQALKSTAFEILYGGARGGGKTDAGMVWVAEPVWNPAYRGLVIRRNAKDLSDWISRAKVMYRGMEANFAYRPTEITFPTGATIKTGHLRDSDAYTQYQGHEYQRILIEELTQIPDEKRYLQLIASCRSTVTDLPSGVFATTNPGGLGHAWVKKRFVDPALPGKRFAGSDNGRTRIFIPARIEDTPQLVENDPGYIQFLEGLKNSDTDLWKAWRLGDWDTFAGQFFKEFRRDQHVIKPFMPRAELVKIGGMDWGRTAPFAFLGSVVINVEHEGVKFRRVVTYQEVYSKVGDTVVGRTPREWAEIISDRVDLKEYRWIQADPAMFTKGQDGSISIADQFGMGVEEFKRLMQPASNDRIGGWENLHNWLSIAPDGLPYWIITENCQDLIRTLPQIVHDETNVEDVDTGGEDHAPDAARYMLKRVTWIDAKVGGLSKHPYRTSQPVGKAPVLVDADAFALPEKKIRDWRR